MADQMAALPFMSVPAPKGVEDYLVPDVLQWATWLAPGRASSDVAHKE
ncbi:MAG TPA: hypothetical protein VHO69_04130 [Phototrophicaceae bacterium]|nr:hypothetical protein [Phototrophicaceae bacterium]